MGADQEGILFVTRHESGDHMEALGDALAADELMGKLVAKGTEHSAGGMARIIRMFR